MDLVGTALGPLSFRVGCAAVSASKSAKFNTPIRQGARVQYELLVERSEGFRPRVIARGNKIQSRDHEFLLTGMVHETALKFFGMLIHMQGEPAGECDLNHVRVRCSGRWS